MTQYVNFIGYRYSTYHCWNHRCQEAIDSSRFEAIEDPVSQPSECIIPNFIYSDGGSVSFQSHAKIRTISN
jgi:hypothetical protein